MTHTHIQQQIAAKRSRKTRNQNNEICPRVRNGGSCKFNKHAMHTYIHIHSYITYKNKCTVLIVKPGGRGK